MELSTESLECLINNSNNCI